MTHVPVISNRRCLGFAQWRPDMRSQGTARQGQGDNNLLSKPFLVIAMNMLTRYGPLIDNHNGIDASHAFPHLWQAQAPHHIPNILPQPFRQLLHHNIFIQDIDGSSILWNSWVIFPRVTSLHVFDSFRDVRPQFICNGRRCQCATVPLRHRLYFRLSCHP